MHGLRGRVEWDSTACDDKFRWKYVDEHHFISPQNIFIRLQVQNGGKSLLKKP